MSDSRINNPTLSDPIDVISFVNDSDINTFTDPRYGIPSGTSDPVTEGARTFGHREFEIDGGVIPPAARIASAANFTRTEEPEHPNIIPPTLHEQHMTLFNTQEFLHIYLSPGYLGILASATYAHQNPEVSRATIILHPGTDYKLLIQRIHHAVKSVNPPAWGVSDIPPLSWSGWGVKLFLPMNGPRLFKDLWEVIGNRVFHLEVRLVPPEEEIDNAWFCVSAEQLQALENYRGDAEVDMYARFP